MRSLTELMRCAEGTAFLERHGVYGQSDAFLEQLEPPVSRGLTDLLGLQPDSRLVYLGQQACADYEPPTTWKFLLARDLEKRAGVICAVLWHDMYQADADRYGTRLLLPEGSSRTRGIWLVPRSVGKCEPRLLPIERCALEAALAEVATWLDSAPCSDRKAARARLATLKRSILEGDIATLGRANGAFASCLLREGLQFDPPSTFTSEMLKHGLLTKTIDEYLALIDDVIAVFNAAVERLISLDIDPCVRPLSADYLPLHYSCPTDGTRLRLVHERDHANHFAAATCRRCNVGYRFFLGSGKPGLGELQETERWSPDVALPVFHNDAASGWIAGRSTALYGLVMNEVLEKVLGRRPIPALVPYQFTKVTTAEPASRSLLIDYLTRPDLSA